MYQFVIGLGLLMGVIVDNSSHSRTDTGAFRIPMAVQLVFPIIFIPGLLLFAPESPRWLLMKGKSEEARQALTRLNGNHPEVVGHELKSNRQAIENDERDHSSSWLDLFKWGPEGRKAYLGFALQGMHFLSRL
jgi:SP family sugar:H+ symporter-like MFS transporter